MTLINLENYLNKEVVIKLQSGATRTGQVRYSDIKHNPDVKYTFENVSHYNKFGQAYSSEGNRNVVIREYDIVEIQPTNNTAYVIASVIASALKENALQYVQTNNKFADVVVELLDEYIKENIGVLNKNVKGDVIQSILDSLVLS
jgi:small nuclear ribonucleoprotein (snRNP)-like protein